MNYEITSEPLNILFVNVEALVQCEITREPLNILFVNVYVYVYVTAYVQCYLLFSDKSFGLINDQ